jgi:hypothetical protein
VLNRIGVDGDLSGRHQRIGEQPAVLLPAPRRRPDVCMDGTVDGLRYEPATGTLFSPAYGLPHVGGPSPG